MLNVRGWSALLCQFSLADMRHVLPSLSLSHTRFEAADKDPETVWRDLRYNGYDNGLNLAGARTFVVSVHSTCKAGL